MDPNANLAEQTELIQEMREYMKDGTTQHPAYLNASEDLAGLRESLRSWLARGGFQPYWRQYPLAARHFGK